MGGSCGPAGRANLPPGSATLTTVRYVAIAIITVALLASIAISERAAQAAKNRDVQQADSNDVVVSVTLVGCTIVIALSAVVFAVLS